MAIVRTEGDAQAAVRGVRDVVQSRFGPLKSSQIRLLMLDVDATRVPWRGRSAMLILIALLCVPVAFLGLSSGLLFAVRAHTREIGIRLALGASPSQARWNVISAALLLTSIGGAIGVVIGSGIAAWMDSQLFEVSPIDPLIVVTALGGMLAIAWCSSLIPAARASRIDPATVLRAD